jgi:hypothetical protein
MFENEVILEGFQHQTRKNFIKIYNIPIVGLSV